MEQNQQDKIVKLLPKLQLVTTYNVQMTTMLMSKNVFSLADKSKLESIPDLLERITKFYEILMTKTSGYVHLIDCLRATKQTIALEILQENLDGDQMPSSERYFGCPDSPKYIQISESVKGRVDEEATEIKRKRLVHFIHDRIFKFHVREPSKLFTGRTKELDALTNSLKSHGSTAVISQKSSIVGLGGVGKSQLAKKFIQSIDFTVNDPMFNTIVWINAEKDATTNKDFRTLATDWLRISTLNANGKEEEIQIVLDKIYRLLETRKTLIIFDNAENPDLVEKYRPTNLLTDGRHTSGSISILITSQESCWAFDHQIHLSGLEQEDAIEFVKKGLNISDDACHSEIRNQILQLVCRLQCFPLAIDQAIAFIKERRTTRQDYGPEDYLTDLNSRTSFFLTKHLHSGTESLYKKTVGEIVTMALDKIKLDEFFGSAAVELVKMMAYMESDNIPSTIFKQRFDEFTLDGALGLLKRYSIVAYSQTQKGCPLSVFMHRLVQDVIRITLAEDGQEECTLRQCLALCNSDGYINIDTVDHIISWWKFAVKHSILVGEFSFLPCMITDVLTNLSRFLYAYDFASTQLQLLQKILHCKENTDVQLKFNMERAIVKMLFRYKLEGCKEYSTSTIDKAIKVLNEFYPKMLKIQMEVDNIGREQAEFSEALTLYEKVCSPWKLMSNRKKRENYPELLLSIGESYRLFGRHSDAAKAFRDVIYGSEKIGVKNYSVVTAAKCSLAMAKTTLVDPSAALVEIRQAVNYAEQHLHGNHSILVQTKITLGYCLEQSGRFAEALEVYDSLHAQLVSAFGHNYGYALFVNLNIVDCVIELDQRQGLLKKAEQVHDDFKQKYGESHYCTLSAYATVGIALYSLDKSEKALFIISNCLASSNFIKRASTAKTWRVKLYAALCLEKLGRFKEALVYLEEIREGDSGGISNCSENNYWKSKVHVAYQRVNEHCKE